MRRVFAKVAGLFRSGTPAGVDKAGNRYFTRLEDVDGILKEKRWVIFKGEEDPTSIPVEWICWLNGQRKKAPTPQEMMELEARRERVKLNIAILKREEEEEKMLSNHLRKNMEKSTSLEEVRHKSSEEAKEFRSPEPTGSGSSYKPGTWQPPT